MKNNQNNLIPPHGGYRTLKSYQTAELIYNLTVEFCRRYISGDRSNTTYRTYQPYLAKADMAANGIICLIHQANYLLDRQLTSLGQKFLEEGGFTEKLYSQRIAYRTNKTDS